MFEAFLLILQFCFTLPLVLPLYLYDKIKNKRCHIYGIEGYFGLMGKGKTICMTERLNRLRKKYGNDILITTNYFYENQDFSFTDWKQLLNNYDKPLVVAWDEVQNEFSSRNFKDFPIELLTQLTQVRKNNGILILYSAQRIDRVDKVFRELTLYSWDCNTWLGRFTFCKKYHTFDFLRLNNSLSEDNRLSIHPLKINWFIQSKKLRNCYDSFRMLESAKTREYMDRVELATINSVNAVRPMDAGKTD